MAVLPLVHGAGLRKLALAGLGLLQVPVASEAPPLGRLVDVSPAVPATPKKAQRAGCHSWARFGVIRCRESGDEI